MQSKIPFKAYLRHAALALLAIPLMVVPTPSALAAAERDRESLFWSLHRDGEVAGYLLGTIHSEDPRVLDFSPAMLQKLSGSQVFAMEMVPDLPTLARLTEYMQYPPGQSLSDLIGRERFDDLAAALSGHQVPVDYIDRMKPWAAMMTLSTPPPVTGFYMDLSLSLRASGAGLEVVGLETLEQQLSFLEEMPVQMQLQLLDHAIDEHGRVAEAHDRMVEVYLQDDLIALQALSDEQMLDSGRDARDYFNRAGIVERNLRMADALSQQLEKGRVFTAVGALHLHGERGLVALLRGRGLELKPLPMPLTGVRKP